MDTCFLHSMLHDHFDLKKDFIDKLVVRLIKMVVSGSPNIYCAVLLIFTMQKNAPPRAQNMLLDDENLKQGLVGGCPAPHNSYRENGEFYNDRTRIYTKLYSE